MTKCEQSWLYDGNIEGGGGGGAIKGQGNIEQEHCSVDQWGDEAT